MLVIRQAEVCLGAALAECRVHELVFNFGEGGRVDPQDVCSQGREQARGNGSRDHSGQVQDPQPVERRNVVGQPGAGFGAIRGGYCHRRLQQSQAGRCTVGKIESNPRAQSRGPTHVGLKPFAARPDSPGYAAQSLDGSLGFQCGHSVESPLRLLR